MSIFSAVGDTKKKGSKSSKNDIPPPLLPRLNAYLASLPTVDKSRKVDCFHPSQIGTCPRAQILARMGAPAENNLFGGMELYQGMMVRIFDNGTASHERLQGYEKDMEILHGDWYCHYCKTEIKDKYGSKDMKCPKCKRSKFIEYNEIRINRPDLELYGKTDGRLTLNDVSFLQEIKTIKKEFYDVIASFAKIHMHPEGRVRLNMATLDTLVEDIQEAGNKKKCKPADMREVIKLIKKHIEQFAIYMYGTKSRYGVILYENKSNQLIEEFLITFTRDMIDPTINKIKYMQDCIEKSTLPLVEEMEVDYKCKECGVRRVCGSPKKIKALYATYNNIRFPGKKK